MGKKATILVVEDDTQYRGLLKEVLANEGYDVRLGSDGNEGVALFKYWKPALVITDMIMPNSEGLDLVEFVKESSPNIPIIAISGGYRNSKNVLEMGRCLGVDISLEKPFSIDTLIAAVASLLPE